MRRSLCDNGQAHFFFCCCVNRRRQMPAIAPAYTTHCHARPPLPRPWSAMAPSTVCLPCRLAPQDQGVVCFKIKELCVYGHPSQQQHQQQPHQLNADDSQAGRTAVSLAFVNRSIATNRGAICCQQLNPRPAQDPGILADSLTFMVKAGSWLTEFVSKEAGVSIDSSEHESSSVGSLAGLSKVT